MSGLSRTPGKRVQVNSLTGVRIPVPPPVEPPRARTVKTGLSAGLELAFCLVQRAVPIDFGRLRSCLAPNGAWQAHAVLQTPNGATRRAVAITVHPHPDLLGAADSLLGVPRAFDPRHPLSLSLRTGADARRLGWALL